MKQIIISIAMLAVALALVVAVIIPLLEHGAAAGDTAVSAGRIILPEVKGLFK